MVSYLFCFIFIGDANCVTTHELCHAWWFGDRFFVFNSCKKAENNTVRLSERTSFGAVKTHLAPSTIRWKRKTYVLFFFSRAAAFFLKRTSLLFSRQKCHAKLCALVRTCYNVQVFFVALLLLLLRNVVWDSHRFFLVLIFTWGEVLLGYTSAGVKRNFWPLRNFWPIIVCQLLCFTE